MSDIGRDRALSAWSAGGVGTNSGVTVTQTGVANQKTVVEHISGSGDAAALVTLTVTKSGSSFTWKKRFAAAFTFSETLPSGCYIGDDGTNVTLNISASTSNCEANACGVLVDY